MTTRAKLISVAAVGALAVVCYIEAIRGRYPFVSHSLVRANLSRKLTVLRNIAKTQCSEADSFVYERGSLTTPATVKCGAAHPSGEGEKQHAKFHLGWSWLDMDRVEVSLANGEIRTAVFYAEVLFPGLPRTYYYLGTRPHPARDSGRGALQSEPGEMHVEKLTNRWFYHEVTDWN